MRVEVVEDRIEVFAVGSFDAAAARDAQEQLRGLLAAGHRHFVIDLEAVEFIDSTGLGVLVGLLKKVRIGEGSVRLRGVRPDLQDILRLTRLDRAFELMPNRGKTT